MNRNLTPLILIVLALGIYFTFTRIKLDELKAIRDVNTQYKKAIDNSEKLVKVRDEVMQTYNSISLEDQERLEKMLPDNVDNVRLIIDINGVAASHNLAIKNIKTSADGKSNPSNSSGPDTSPSGLQSMTGGYNTVTVNFDVKSSYQNFLNFLKDLESSLRILEISKITLQADDKTSEYQYSVEIKTFWLK